MDKEKYKKLLAKLSGKENLTDKEKALKLKLEEKLGLLNEESTDITNEKLLELTLYLKELTKYQEKGNKINKEQIEILNQRFGEVSVGLNELKEKQTELNEFNKEFGEMIEQFKDDISGDIFKIASNTAREIKLPPDRSDEVIQAIKDIELNPIVNVEQKEYNLVGITKVLEAYFKANKEWIERQTLTVKLKDKDPIKVNVVDKNGRIVDLTKIFGGGGYSAFHTGWKNSAGNEDYVTLTSSGKVPVEATITSEPETYDSFEQKSLSVTATTGSVSFTQPVKSVLIENTGANDAYINFGAAATTSHYRLAPYESMSLELTFTALHAICDATKTTTLRAIGLF